MIKVWVTRTRIDDKLSGDLLLRVMASEFDAIFTAVHYFVVDTNRADEKGNLDKAYLTMEEARAWLGPMTVLEFTEIATQVVKDIPVTPQERRDIRFAYEHKAPTLPPWIRVLEAAKSWGCPPWEIANDGQRELWFRRFSVVETIRAEVMRNG